MKVAILHHDLEWAEKKMERLLKDKGFEVSLIDIRFAKEKDFEDFDCVINRIYASVANRDCSSNVRALKLLKDLENSGIFCINSYKSTLCDYSKYHAYNQITSQRVPTPKTLKIDSFETKKGKIDNFVSEVGFPIILKRDMGGRGKDIQKINSMDVLLNVLEKIFSTNDQYNQGYILQEFIKNNRGYDCRIAIVNGDFAFSYKRSLISLGEEDSLWLASVSRGSISGNYKPSEEEINLAKKSTEAIGALFNEADITFTKEGPIIIENNPTPNYVENQDEDKIREAVNLIAKKIKEKPYV